MRTLTLAALLLLFGAGSVLGATAWPIPGRREEIAGKFRCYCPSDETPHCVCQYTSQEPIDECDWFRNLPTYYGEDTQWIYLHATLDGTSSVFDMMQSGDATVAISKSWCTP